MTWRPAPYTPTPERNAEIQDALQRVDIYFEKLAEELDPTHKRFYSSTLIHHIRRYIHLLAHDLEQQQLPASERGANTTPLRRG